MEKKILFIFLEIITITITFCTFCGINPPKSSKYCGNYIGLNGTHRCCYCTNKNTNESYCLIVVKNVIPFDEYNCNCDNIEEDDDLPGAPCRGHEEIVKTDPDNITDLFCHSHSKDDKHPCCYYDDGNIKTCFSIGKITFKTLYTYCSVLNCFSKYHTIT